MLITYNYNRAQIYRTTNQPKLQFFLCEMDYEDWTFHLQHESILMKNAYVLCYLYDAFLSVILDLRC